VHGKPRLAEPGGDARPARDHRQARVSERPRGVLVVLVRDTVDAHEAGSAPPSQGGQSSRERDGRVVRVHDVRLEPAQGAVDRTNGGQHLARATLDQREVEALRAGRQLGGELAVLRRDGDGVPAVGSRVGERDDHPLGAADTEALDRVQDAHQASAPA